MAAAGYCADASQLDAAGWVLDALEPDEADRFSAHLFSCRTCQLTVEELEVTARLLLGSPPPRPPERLEFAALDRVRKATHRPRQSRR